MGGGLAGQRLEMGVRFGAGILLLSVFHRSCAMD